MKILRICPAPSHITQFRHEHALQHKTFDEQIKALQAENLLLPGGWAGAMKAEGFEVFETLYSDPALQATWAREHGLSHLPFEGDYLFRILEEQIRWFQPRVIFLYAGAFFYITRALRERLRAIGPYNMIITGLWGDELPPGYTYANYFGDLDVVYCSSPKYKKHFDLASIPAVTLGNSFDPSIKYQAPAQKKYDFVFCGTTGFGIPEHLNRYKSLKQLMAKTSLQMWANESPFRSRRLKMKLAAWRMLAKLPNLSLRVMRRFGRGRWRHAANLALRAKEIGYDPSVLSLVHEHPLKWIYEKEKPLRELYPSRVKRQPVNGSDYYRLLAESKIVLNLHRDEDADIGNIRCYEATGLGSCLVTDRGEDLKALFDIENDIVTVNSVEECIEKVNYLLAHPEEMERIAKNGQRTTLARHTVAHRCAVIAKTLRELNQKPIKKRRKVVLATYDLERHPISYDVAFFLQAADIYRQQLGCDDVIVRIVAPADVANQPGVSKTVDAIVDGHAREYRIFQICVQMAELMPTMAVMNVKNRLMRDVDFDMEGMEVIHYPETEGPHHSEYYRLVNGNPELMTGFSATIEAHRYVRRWLDIVRNGRKVLCVTLRQYKVDTERNSNIAEWASFLSRVDQQEFAIVILPDTDHIDEFKKSALNIYPHFEPACFNVDLRMALYEEAYLNMFVNNGPSVAATLNKKVNYLLFKILLPHIPTCAGDFLRWLGYEIGGTPGYATPFQKWVWDFDSADVLWREFNAMCERIDAAERQRRDAPAFPIEDLETIERVTQASFAAASQKNNALGVVD